MFYFVTLLMLPPLARRIDSYAADAAVTPCAITPLRDAELIAADAATCDMPFHLR